MQATKEKIIICKILSGHYSEKEYSPVHGFEDLCFVSVAPIVCVSHAFVYDAVNENQIIVISSTKHPYA